jgi:putative membrane protein
MKRTIQGLLLAGAMVVSSAALAQSNTQGKGTAKGGMIEHLGFMVPADEKAMLERLHHVNQEEIKLGKLAQQNGQSPDVKSYGEMLVKDHTAADQKLMSYARQKGLKLAEPKPLNDVERKAMAAQKANGEKLQALKGLPFDSCFLASMVGGHDEVLGKLMAGRENVADVALSPLLQELSQTFSQHRQQAYTLLGRVGPGSSPGVGGSGQMVEGLAPDTDIGKSDTDKDIQRPSDKNTMDPGNPKKF